MRKCKRQLKVTATATAVRISQIIRQRSLMSQIIKQRNIKKNQEVKNRTGSKKQKTESVQLKFHGSLSFNSFLFSTPGIFFPMSIELLILDNYIFERT